jgi:hypothetical protein
LLLAPASSVYYTATAGAGCASCHEIQASFDQWRGSTHRGVACSACHGGSMTLDASFHLGNLRRVSTHLGGELPEQIRIRNLDAQRMMERCQGCHRQEYADWQAGPHGATYARIFLDATHNSKQRLRDDCLRCHGAFFDGGIGDLVTPVDSRGPWRLVAAEWGARPAMPCMSCHEVHRRGEPLRKPAETVPGPKQETHRPSLALYDRRSGSHVPVERLSLPAVMEGARPVKMSPDARQALCYQCHAPLAGAQVGSGDDRTGVGVHEGISCLGCHLKHGQQTRASCASCHPRLSNCGLDVEKMDTTFVSPKSGHNIHFVKCGDCHPRGVPKKPGVSRAAD